MQEIVKYFLAILFALACNKNIAQVEMNFDFNTPYGKNENVGNKVEINGTDIYYEEYGKGEPLFLIHGNGGSVLDMGNQIDYFRSRYRVIIADNRGHGKSGLDTDSLTYRQITRDWEALAKKLELDPINIIGWSDGGIVGLLMGINQNIKVKKIVAMGANLRPDTTAIYSWMPTDVKKTETLAKEKLQEGDTTQNWNLIRQEVGLLLHQPNISHSELKEITCPVLIIAGDKDIIREEHTVEIYQNIKNAQLCIMPGETHFAPASSPEKFNAIVAEFLSSPFRRPDSDWTKW